VSKIGSVPPPRPDLFISADIETDGPIPGQFSMLSFGLCVASRYDGQRFERVEPGAEDVFYAELKPVTPNYQPEAMAVNNLDRHRLLSDGVEPAEAMKAASEWVLAHSVGARPVLVAYPVAFDWAFLYWYFVRFANASPFGFSSCLDIRTLYQARALTPFDNSSKGSMPDWLRPRLEHTHNAAEDALERAELFNNIFQWALEGGGRDSHAPLPEDSGPNWLEPLDDPYLKLRAPGVLGSAERRRRERHGTD
jgi:hypothetical protein